MNGVFTELRIDLTSFGAKHSSSAPGKRFEKTLDVQELMQARLLGTSAIAELVEAQLNPTAYSQILLRVPRRAIYVIILWDILSKRFDDNYPIWVSTNDILRCDDDLIELQIRVGMSKSFIVNYLPRRDKRVDVIKSKSYAFAQYGKVSKDNTIAYIEIGDYLAYSVFSLVQFLSLHGTEVRIIWPENLIQEDMLGSSVYYSHTIEPKRIAC